MLVARKSLNSSIATLSRSIRAVLLLLVFICSGGPVFSLERIDINSSDEFSKLVRMDKKLMIKSADLQILIARAQKASSSKYKFRKWIDIAGQETSAAGLMAATIVGVDELGPKLNTPLRIRLNRLKRGLNVGIVGSIIGASASASQLGLDVLHVVRNRKKGYGPAAVSHNFIAGMVEYDALWNERMELYNSSKRLQSSKVLQATTKLLKLRRELVAKEFYEVFTYTFSNQCAQSIYYGFDIARNTTAAVGIDLLKRGLRKPRLNEPGNVWLIVTSGITIAAPWLSTGSGKLIAKYKKWRIRKKLSFDNNVSVEDLLSARKEVRAAIVESQSSNAYTAAIQKSEILDTTHDLFKDRIKNLLDTKRKLRQTAFQQKLASLAVGGQFLGFSTAGLVGWQRYGQNGRIIKFNKTLFGANIVGLSASSLAVGATGAAAIGGEIYEWRLKKRKSRPIDLLNEHIERIENVRAEVYKIPE